jgi:hypothetical protein
MATIKTIRKKFEALNTDDVLAKAFESSVDGFTAEQKKQLYAGLNKEGGRLRKYRNNKYARVKNEMNPAPGLGNPDLFVTGAFYEGVEVKLAGQAIDIQSIDEKGPDLKEKYHPFGLGGDYRKEFIDNVYQPNFRKEVKKRTGL